MKNRTTISAHVDQATIERIDQLAKLENRSRSQMTGTAIKLGAELSPEAWSVLLQLNSQGSEEDWQGIREEMTRRDDQIVFTLSISSNSTQNVCSNRFSMVRFFKNRR
jgi:hypothetical protein